MYVQINRANVFLYSALIFFLYLFNKTLYYKYKRFIQIYCVLFLFNLAKFLCNSQFLDENETLQEDLQSK
jgi:hypothetical protein